MSASTNVQTAAGTTISVSAALPATHDAAGFVALTFTEVGEVTDAGDIPSRVYNEVTHSPLSQREVITLKGSYSQSPTTMVIGDDISDAGQVLLKAGAASDDCYSFKVEYQNGDIDYFTALVFQFSKNLGDNNTIVGRTLQLNTQNDVVEVDTP